MGFGITSTIRDKTITDAKLVDMGARSIKGNSSTALATPSDIGFDQLAALMAIPPVFKEFTSSGTWQPCFYITLNPAAPLTASAGDTYSNDGNTFTVEKSVSSASFVYMRGPALPNLSSPTFTRTSGSGTSSVTARSYRAPTYIKVVICGGGGGAGGVSNNTYRCAGGGSGAATGFKTIPFADLGATESITIGAGGAGGTTANGNDGGSSSFGSHVSAGGGFLGTGDVTTQAQGTEGNSTATGADYVVGGGSGGGGMTMSTATRTFSGAGGSSYFGGGARQRLGNISGVNATNFGSGGSAPSNAASAAAQAGGDGRGGKCDVQEFYQ